MMTMLDDDMSLPFVLKSDCPSQQVNFYMGHGVGPGAT